MVQLAISVPLANILLWTITEALIVLMSFHATRLLARYLLNNRLSNGRKVDITPSSSIVDALPYNSDLEPLPRNTKLILTAIRFAAVAISVYLGATLDAAVAPIDTPFAATKATALATNVADRLTKNDGKHIPAMAKLSCLRILDNNNIKLYRGYVADENILCEDGIATYTTHLLVHAQIRAETRSDEKLLDISSLDITGGEERNGLSIERDRITFSPADSEMVTIVWISRDGEWCTFGLTRSQGSDFVDEVNIQVTMNCKAKVIDFDRMLAPKPGCIPPRMSFLHQTLDALVVEEAVDSAPARKSDVVQATITLGGLITSVVSAVVITAFAIVLWFALRIEGMKNDFTSVKGLAEMWGEEKFGSNSQDKLFIAMPMAGGSPYLGSMDGKAGNGQKHMMDLSDLEDGKGTSSGFDDSMDTEDSVEDSVHSAES